MKKTSAGLLMYRQSHKQLEIFLAHPGGPYLKDKDNGHWGIPKGEVEENEAFLDAAIREFQEETGIEPHGEYFSLGSVVLASGKEVFAWAFEGDWDETQPIQSNLFSLEWPPHSGNIEWFPEIDTAAFFPVPLALIKMNLSQAEFIPRLKSHLLDH